jgi:cell division protein ZapD
LLRLLRDAGVPHRVVAKGGQYQQSLPQGKTYQLLRVRIDPNCGLVPEITGHRLMVSVRLMRPDADGRLRPATEETALDLALCA